MYYETIFEQYKQDLKNTCAILSDILHRKAINSLPDTITVQGHDCSDRKVIAEEFNNYIATVREWNGHTNSQGDCNFRDYISNRQIDNTSTIRIIKNLKMSQSKGHDGNSSELVKLINNDISCCITLIINQSLTSGIYYRPISVLPVISKIFETVMHEQLTKHFMNNILFNPQQYDFRKNSSTELAGLELIDKLLNQLNNHSIPINFYIDPSKAFDSLRHDILRGVCRISQGGGPTFNMPRSGMSRAAKLRAFARGVWGHAPPRKFLIMVQFRAF